MARKRRRATRRDGRARPDRPRSRPLRGLGDASNVAQLAVTVAVALAALIAALISSAATGEWQRALREDIKRSAAALADIRVVYTVEAPPAFRIALAEIRAEELRLRRSAAARHEAETESQAAAQLRFAERGRQTLVDGERYQAADHSFDVPRRLADVRGRDRDLVRIDPEAAQRSADGLARTAFLVVCAVYPLVIGYLVAQAVLARRRTARRHSGDLGMAPEPVGDDPRRFTLSVAVLCWLALSTLVPFQMLSANQEQRAHAMAARQADRVSALIGASSVRSAFDDDSARIARETDLRAETRRYALIEADDPAQRAVAAADSATAERAERVARVMGREPAVTDGVDAFTVELLAAEESDWWRHGAAQAAQADAAERAGSRNTWLSVAILFAGLAASLASVAAVARGSVHEGLWRWIARLFLVACAGAALYAFT